MPETKELFGKSEDLGEHLKKRRLELGLTQTEAGVALGVNPFTVLNWERERTKPRTIDCKAIFAFLGYDPFPKPATIGERLLQKRREHGRSTREAARHLGVDQCTWGDWEPGELILFRGHRARVAALLGLDPGELSAEMGHRWSGKHRQLEGNSSQRILPPTWHY